ncbi:MAG TPA: DUF2933 domain-containing protein [Methanosarcina sp.]|nr:DUF2933 domain-containing protein [Methanosarcina sp.]
MNGASCNSKSNFVIKAVVLFSLAIIAFYLLIEHRAHLLAYSSYILLLGFILLHVFMCGGHGKHGGHEMNGGHRECCGGGHDHGKHNHKETEQKENGQKGEGRENTHQNEHNKERFI